MSYQRLTKAHRYQIKALKDSGLTIRKMAGVLGVTPSTISRELKRCPGKRYSPATAHFAARKRRAGIGPKVKIQGLLKETINELLCMQWSPEQISGRLKKSATEISHEAIYQHIYRDFKAGGELYRNLRRKRKHRRTWEGSRNFKKCGKRINQSWIEERPAIVEKRERIGDFERDTMLGRNGRLLTIVDRASRLTKIAKLVEHNSLVTHRATLRLLEKEKVHTITNDNGPEFGLHDLTAKELNAKVYFNHPYSAWQRGTNENTNGLLRQYFPKGTDFSLVTEEKIKEAEQRLNHRPRKCLGYRTPAEVHHAKVRALQ